MCQVVCHLCQDVSRLVSMSNNESVTVRKSQNIYQYKIDLTMPLQSFCTSSTCSCCNYSTFLVSAFGPNLHPTQSPQLIVSFPDKLYSHMANETFLLSSHELQGVSSD